MLPHHRIPAYAELHCRSNFSYLSGASHPKELVAQAAQRGYAALAITDECSLGGVVHAHEAARGTGLHLIVGARMQLVPGGNPSLGETPVASVASATPAAPITLLLHAMSRRGYGNLSQWITVARRRAEKGTYTAYRADLEGRVPQAPHLAGLPGCLALLHVESPAETPFEAVFAQAMWLKTWFGDRAGLSLSLRLGPHDALLRATLARVAALTGLPLVATGDVLMHVRSRKPLQDVLTATRLRQPLADCGWALQPNAEAHLRSRQRLAVLYGPHPECLDASVQWAARCSFSLDELRYEYPEEIVPAGHTPDSWLRELVRRGAARRFPADAAGGVSASGGAETSVPPAVRALLDQELALIAQLKFEPYFLTVADIVDWARSQDILCQGRGSAANSAVCYCLGITEVDPSRSSVLFGRFISAERNEPPDIDVDFEHQRREEVIQYIYRKYGRHRAALTGVTICYRPRSALRDVGRALGLDSQRVDAVSRGLNAYEGGIEPERLRENGFDPDAPLCRLWLELSATLIGFPRHLSQHPGGFVIARDDLSRLVPVENAAMDGRTVIQWDKDDLDALGLIKVDVLALGMLSALRRALAFIAFKHAAPAFRLQDIPSEDAATYAMLCRGDSVGTFQVESRAQMSMLPRLQPRCFYDLVIEVAIVRPGPIQGGMVHPYLRRRSGEEAVSYPSDAVRQALQRTLGVPIFQEQVMQLAILAADFTPGEADSLRRAMAAWKRRGGLGPFHERLVGRMVAKGYERDYAEAIFRQIQGFGEYGFPESHAASFALLVYASAWIKCHHPDAFLAALLDSQPLGFYAPAQLVRDAREHGVHVRPVDVRLSDWNSTLVPPDGPVAVAAATATGPHPGLFAVRLGLNRLSGLEKEAGLRIVAARDQAPFDSVEDLTRRAQLDAQALQGLAQAGALAGLAGHRHDAAWAAAGVDTHATALLHDTRTHEAPAALAAPDRADDMLADYRRTGLSLTTHPLTLLRPHLDTFRVQTAADLKDHGRNGQLARASGLVTHRQRPETAKGVVFVTLEDDTGSVNVIVWPAVAQAQRRPLRAASLLTVYGVWQKQGEVRHLVAQRLVDHTPLLQGLATRSRDFR